MVTLLVIQSSMRIINKERYMNVYVKIKLLDGGKLPVYKRNGDACMDCYASKKVRILPGKRALVPLGFALELPANYEAVIRPRSGLSNNKVDIAIGTIDSNYRGEVSACVINKKDIPFCVNVGDRICQLAVRETPTVIWQEVDTLSESERGADGFGSSGINDNKGRV